MKKEDVRISCEDGIQLAATIYFPEKLQGAVMVAPATGIKRRFYNAFATFLSENGYGVICYDNRGIGDSVKGSINDMDASLINWGRLDMTAVLEQLKTSFPNQSYHLVGHSAGGQLVGLMKNALELKSMYNFASSSGCLKNMKYPFRFGAGFYLNVFIPVSNFLFGKTNSQWVGMGEPLPKKVASQWRRWCNGSGYVATDFGKAVKEHLYDDLTFNSHWSYATDDAISNYANVKDMVRVYSKSDSSILELDPQKMGIKKIGHMSFFSSKNSKLWSHTLEWLQMNG